MGVHSWVNKAHRVGWEPGREKKMGGGRMYYIGLVEGAGLTQ